MRSIFLKILIIMVSAGLLAGCSIKHKFTINDPIVSNFKYDLGPKNPVVMKIVDQRTNKIFNVKLASLKEVNIDLANADDPIAWLSQALEKEFAARDIPLKIADKNTTNPPDLVLTIKKYQLVSRLVTWFSPWESYHSFMGEVAAGGQTYDIRAYFFNGKVYGGSMKEVEEPCFNTPMSIMVKEIASKINRYALHYTVSDGKIAEIQTRAEKKIKAQDDDAYRPVLELGNSNNPNAVKTLIKFAAVEDNFTRACAISGIGTLAAQDQLDFLKKKYSEYVEIDKYMTLKSIGDLGTPDAINFLRKAKDDPQYNSEYGFKYVVDLYLER
ncbi:MAG TPA: HEAT repeat domain-containing protein [Nitrospirota bacterium]|nr:HEAT repeat domain-containing protein [Nitrospirota bacterium]